MNKETIYCRLHGNVEKMVVSVDGGPSHDECVKCVEILEAMKYRVTNIGPLNLPKLKEHEYVVYGQE